MDTTGKLKLNLLQNALDYLNEALVSCSRAREQSDQRSWKSALLNLSFCIELMLKEKLRREHPLLVFDSINKFRPITRETKTVSWTTLIERLKYVLGNEFSRMDAGRTVLAQMYRNQMLHYDVYLEFPEVYHNFANLLNFITDFYNNFLRGGEDDSLHHHIRQKLWMEEDNLIDAFEEHVVFYNDIFMPVSLKKELEAEQSKTTITLDGQVYKRIPYGDPMEHVEIGNRDYCLRPCGDCAASKGQIHLIGCDIECCPKCGRQLLSCRCRTEDFDKPEM